MLSYEHNLSIGMPVYNGAKFIREALDSLLAQTFTDFELIISDNASTDETEAICREYAAKDKRIRYVRQAQNLGAAANFKYVLDEARGEYFMWAAADAEVLKDSLRG
ncbi:glycosyltransferase family 2 protein [Thermosynechococcus sp. QKsg1]|nr:glycosyltransferase family 2 protein [Thermosynechococcus sp. QKsg1]WNC86000.1 glycosyltransferase family 2 protein [Thermosynechococcus sp. QKsg1]